MTPAEPARPLRVLLATPYGENGMGGIDRLNDAIIDNFERGGFNLSCERLVTRGKGSLWAAQAVFAGALARFITLAAARQVDLLHIHLSVRGSSYRKTALARCARAMNVPYVIHLHGTEFGEFWMGANAVLRGELERMFDGSAAVIVLGDYWARVVGSLRAGVRDRLVILPNATASVEVSAPPSVEGLRIAFLGQLGRRKGSADLVHALSRLSPDDCWSAIVAGDGEIAETRQLVQACGLDTRVSVPGWISAEERARLLAASDVLVLPSYAENLPMVVLEAFAHGLPVIATPVGAIPEVITPGRNGLLVEPGDIPRLAAAIEQLMHAPILRQEMGKQARQDHAAKFEITRYLDRLAAIWSAAATGARHHAKELNAHHS